MFILPHLQTGTYTLSSLLSICIHSFSDSLSVPPLFLLSSNGPHPSQRPAIPLHLLRLHQLTSCFCLCPVSSVFVPHGVIITSRRYSGLLLRLARPWNDVCIQNQASHQGLGWFTDVAGKETLHTPVSHIGTSDEPVLQTKTNGEFVIKIPLWGDYNWIFNQIFFLSL